MSEAARISRRKLEHLELAVGDEAEGPRSAGWEDVRLIHDCLPELALEDIQLDTMLLGAHLSAPLWITGMTGGHPRASEINTRLARAAEHFGIAMGVGSQRTGLSAPELMSSYTAAREAAPHAILVANIGAPQLIEQAGRPGLTLRQVQSLIDGIGAQALAIHLNFLQEAVQPEGDRNARGVLNAIRRVVESVSVPVLVKETGAGVRRERARDLCAAGVAALDVAGSGGTSMVRIERSRAEMSRDGRAHLAKTFDDWGIPTAAAVLECTECGVPIIATGGVRSGLDAARALALGATAVGVGRPFLLAAIEGEDALVHAIELFLEELRLALYLTGSRTPGDLRTRGVVLTGELLNWSRQRGQIVD